MVRKITSLMAILALGFIASSASATNLDNGTTGGTVTVTVNTTTIPGATNLVFQPSSQVLMRGQSIRTAFAAISGHAAVEGKEAGQHYGMASDSSNVFWQAAETNALPTSYATTNSSNFTTANNWNRN